VVVEKKVEVGVAAAYLVVASVQTLTVPLRCLANIR